MRQGQEEVRRERTKERKKNQRPKERKRRVEEKEGREEEVVGGSDITMNIHGHGTMKSK